MNLMVGRLSFLLGPGRECSRKKVLNSKLSASFGFFIFSPQRLEKISWLTSIFGYFQSTMRWIKHHETASWNGSFFLQPSSKSMMNVLDLHPTQDSSGKCDSYWVGNEPNQCPNGWIYLFATYAIDDVLMTSRLVKFGKTCQKFTFFSCFNFCERGTIFGKKLSDLSLGLVTRNWSLRGPPYQYTHPLEIKH